MKEEIEFGAYVQAVRLIAAIEAMEPLQQFAFQEAIAKIAKIDLDILTA